LIFDKKKEGEENPPDFLGSILSGVGGRNSINTFLCLILNCKKKNTSFLM